MKRLASLAVAAALTAAGSRAMAQLPGIPYQPVETGTGISVAGDYGKGTSSGSPSAYALTAGLGLGRLGISASVGGIKPSGLSNQTSVGGRFGLKLVGGGLVPLQIGVQVGVASAKVYTSPTTTVTQTVELPGLYAKVSPPLFPLKPFGMVYYQTGNNGISKEARYTLGANFNLLLGFGLHAAYDGGKSGNFWGVGAHFNFRVPGLPGVP